MKHIGILTRLLNIGFECRLFGYSNREKHSF